MKMRSVGGQFSDEVNIGREPAPKASGRFRVYEGPSAYQRQDPPRARLRVGHRVQTSGTGLLFGSAQYKEPIHLTPRVFWVLGLGWC